MQRIADLDERLLSRLTRRRLGPATFGLKALCRLLDPDMIIYPIVLLWLGSPLLVDASNHIAAAAGITAIMVFLVKRAVRRQRPKAALQAYAPPDPHSFPSGHTAGAFAIAICLFGVAPWVVPFALVFAGLVAYARLYLGVHYPIDVLAGATLGTFIGSIIAIF